MDDSLGGFIRRHRHLSEEEAFRAFLDVPAVREWAAADESRRERLRVEFHRVWVTEAPPGAASPQAAVTLNPAPAPAPRAPPAPQAKQGPAAYAPPQVVESAARAVSSPSAQPVQVTRSAGEPPKKAAQGQRMDFMCPQCAGVDIGSEIDGKSIRIRCRGCGREFPNLLELIPVERVGALELVFGGGWRAVAVPTVILAILVGLYLLLRSVRA